MNYNDKNYRPPITYSKLNTLKPMSKPKSEKCDTCYVKSNRLRCSLCKWKTEEWFWNQPTVPITIDGDEDLWSDTKPDEGGDTE